jgi:hypothetical protein
VLHAGGGRRTTATGREQLLDEDAGELVPSNASAADPYELWTGNVLICPLVETGPGGSA